MTTIDWSVSDVPFDQSDWNYRSDPINIKIRLHTDVEFESMFILTNFKHIGTTNLNKMAVNDM